MDSKTIRILIGGVLIGGIMEKCWTKFKRPLREFNGLI
jgi:hypothetical protein